MSLVAEDAERSRPFSGALRDFWFTYSPLHVTYQCRACGWNGRASPDLSPLEAGHYPGCLTPLALAVRLACQVR